MKYYQIGVSVEPKVIGVNNGIHQVELDKNEMVDNLAFSDFLAFFAYSNKDFWENQDIIKNLNIPTINATMLKKANVTDIMGYRPNISFINSLFSEKYIKILKLFDIGEESTFGVAIKDVIEKYYLLFIKTILYDEINFSNSVLYTGHKVMEDVKYHEVNSLNAYNDFKNKFPLYSFEKISIPKSYIRRDVINIRPVVAPFYSEKLIDTLLDFGISGLEPKYKNSITLDFY